MPVTVYALHDSPKLTAGAGGEGSSVELHYAVRGTSSDSLAMTMIQATAPLVYVDAAVGTLVRQKISTEYKGNDVFDCRVSYGPRSKPETGQHQTTFEVSAGSEKITQAISEDAVYVPAGDTAPSFHGAIGVTDNGVEGCQVVKPQMSFSETHYLPLAQVDAAYLLTLGDLTGKLNDATFRGFSAGEVLFMGASGKINNQVNWEVTYKFAVSPNRGSTSVDTITVTSVGGWDYAWIRYEKTVDAGPPKRIVEKPVAVVVDVVYESANFSLLGIG